MVNDTETGRPSPKAESSPSTKSGDIVERNHRGDLVGVTIVIAVALLGFSVIVSHHDWLSGLLVNIGAALLLVAPMYWINKGLERRIARAESITAIAIDSASEAIVALSEELESTRQQLIRTDLELSEVVGQGIAKLRTEVSHAFEALSATSSRADVLKALAVARHNGITCDLGIRVPIDYTELLFRFSTDTNEEANSFPVRVETSDLREVASFDWRVGVGQPDFLLEVGRRLMGTDYWPADAAYHPGTALGHLAASLNVGLRAMKSGERSVVSSIFQVCGDWIVTDQRIISVSHMYSIRFERFAEIDWDRQIRQKSWARIEEFREAYDVATALIQNGEVSGRLPSATNHPAG